MTAEDATAWLTRWSIGFAREGAEFRSVHNYTSAKFAELRAVEDRGSSIGEQEEAANTGEGNGIQSFRAAISLALLGRLAFGSEVGPFGSVLRQIRDDLAMAIFQDLEPLDLHGPSRGFEFIRTPHLAASSRISATAAVVHSRALALEAQVHHFLSDSKRVILWLRTTHVRHVVQIAKVQREKDFLSEELAAAESRIDG
jgi:hypothetical protein